MSDLISRQDAIDVARKCSVKEVTPAYMLIDKAEVMTELMMLPSAHPTQLNTPNTLKALDCISRQDAIDRINKQREHLRPDIYSRDKIGDAAYRICAEFIERLPSAQPDIIRCEDCKWYGRADKRRFYRGMDCLQKRIDTIVPDRDFCSKAERRTDD